MWTQEEFDAWKGRPETRAFMEYLMEVREVLKERWAFVEVPSEKDHAIAMVYGDIIDLNYERDIEPFYKTEVQSDEG